VALVKYPDGKKSYVLATNGLKQGDRITSGPEAKPVSGNNLPLSIIPIGQVIHNIELHPGKGGQIARSAGTSATLMARFEGYAQIKLPSGEIRKVSEKCYATIGYVGNTDHQKTVLGKAGRRRYLGRRPITRAVAKNPVDHPMGGGAGKTAGGGHPVTPWGVLTKGYKTRKRKKYSDKLIMSRRDGRPFNRK
jgi:large subunit ribosomal protein L2